MACPEIQSDLQKFASEFVELSFVMRATNRIGIIDVLDAIFQGAESVSM